MKYTLELDGYRLAQIDLAIEAIRLAGTLDNGSSVINNLQRLKDIYKQLNAFDRENKRVSFISFLQHGEL